MHLFAVVKGSPDAALFAARILHGLPAELARGLAGSNETVLRVQDTPRNRSIVQRWACEPGSVPYPVGACLTYSIGGAQ